MEYEALEYEDLGVPPQGNIYRGARLERAELKGLVPTARTIYARRRTTNQTLSANTELKFFHKGIDDAATEYGFANGTLTQHETNLQRDGKLPNNEVFICNGLSFEFPDDVVAADLRAFSRGVVRVEEGSGSIGMTLGTVLEMPRCYGVDVESGNTSGQNFRIMGPKFRFKKPLFIMRGAAARADNTQIIVKYFAATTIATTTEWVLRLHGVWFQHVSGAR